MHVHHIDEDRSNNELNNLQVLCRSCHYKGHSPKISWMHLYVEIDDDLDARMRRYIKDTWSNPYGKITKVIEEALTAFLDAKEPSL